MGFRSLLSEIVDRRIENGARVQIEDYTFRAAHDCKLSPKGEELAQMADSIGMTRVDLIRTRRFVQAVTKECNERLAREMVVVFTLNDARSRVLSCQRMTKEKACTKAVMGGDLLDLDPIYSGLLVQGINVFVSDTALERGWHLYGEGALNGLIKERSAA